jgi:hypothetical protein
MVPVVCGPPRDVWSSSDGKVWQNCVEKNAPWLHSDLPMNITFADKMWIMGGWYKGRLPGHSASNQVWSSADGVKWEQATASAGWSPRLAAGLVEHRGRMWMLGGTENYYFGDDTSLKNDVWSSADGKGLEAGDSEGRVVAACLSSSRHVERQDLHVSAAGTMCRPTTRRTMCGHRAMV